MTIDHKCPLTIVQIGLKTVHTPTHVSVKVLAFYFLLTRIAHLKQIFCLVKIQILCIILGVEYHKPIEYIYSYYDVPTVMKHLDYS